MQVNSGEQAKSLHPCEDAGFALVGWDALTIGVC